MTQVHISSTNHTVTVNHDGGDLSYIIDKAQKLWDETKSAEPPAGPGIGFTSQISPQWNHDRQNGSQYRPVRADGSPE